MRKIIVALVLLISITFPGFSGSPKGKFTLQSPDKKITVTLTNNNETIGGKSTFRLTYSINCNGKQALLPSALGIDREDQKFTENLEFVSASPLKRIDEHYSLKTGKNLEIANLANEQVFTFRNSNKAHIELIFRAYNDGVAFRYRFPEQNHSLHKVLGEATTFAVPTEGKAWIHPYDWNSRLKPSYEQYCENEIPVGTESPNKKGWAYPMSFNSNGLWMMITEAVMDGTYCGTHIQTTNKKSYKVVLAEKEEVVLPDDPEPVSTLPWTTPWRVIVVGNELATIVETNIVQNLNEPCALKDVSFVYNLFFIGQMECPHNHFRLV